MTHNPSIDAVMSEVLTTIRQACAPIEIDEDAQAEFISVYQPKFGARLANGSWQIDKANVLLAARQHGIIANAIATLRHEKRVRTPVFLEAGLLVKTHCGEVFEEGVWCS